MTTSELPEEYACIHCGNRTRFVRRTHDFRWECADQAACQERQAEEDLS